MTRLQTILGTLAFVLTLPLSPAGAADSGYPDRPIRLIEAFSGGLSTLVSHAVSERLGPALGQAIVVSSLPGAGGQIGLRNTVSATPDGYTLLIGGQWLTTNWALSGNDSTDPAKDLVPIAPILGVPYALFVNSDKPFTTLPAFLDAARQHDNEFTYGSPGVGTGVHLYAEGLFKDVGAKVRHIPYKGGGAQINAILSNEVDFGIMSLASALPQIQAGRIRPLAVTSAQRVAVLPDVPTIAEAGYPRHETTTWFALFGPANLPAEIVQQLNQATLAAFGSKEAQALLEKIGAVPLPEQSPAALLALTQSEKQRWRAAVEQLGLSSK